MYNKPYIQSPKNKDYKLKVTIITIWQRVKFPKNLIDILPQNLQPDEDDVIKWEFVSKSDFFSYF